MSSANALATVTAALASALAEVAYAAWPGSRVFIGRPEQRADQQRNQPAVNIFLYQVAVNPNWRNADAPTRDSRGRLVQRPAIGLDLNYMFTFYGPGFVPQLLMGHVVSRLHARPLLSQVNIRSALSQTDSIPGDMVLKETDLDQFELIRLSPMHFTLDEMSRLWSVFFQTPYDLSIAYQASVVLIEAMDEIPQPALPVHSAGYRPAPGAIPQLEQVTPQFVYPTTAVLTLKGRNLAATGAKVRFGGLVTPVDPEISGPDLVVKLPPDLAAGIIPVSVDAGNGSSSNAAAFVFRPLITTSSCLTVPNPSDAKKPFKHITLDIQPPMQPHQRGLLLLNERPDKVTSTLPRKAYSLSLAQPAAAASTVAVDASSVQPGSYLVRVQIDGAESPLLPPPDGTQDEAFAGPTVTIP
jgi:hypothetical protein